MRPLPPINSVKNWDPLRAMNWWPCLALPHVLFSTKTTIPRLNHHEKATSKCLGFQISIFLDGSWFITHKWDNQIAMSSMKLLVVFGVDLKISTVLIPKSLHESPNIFHQILSHTSHQLPFWNFARKCAMSESLGLQSLFRLGGKNAHQILRQLFITSLGGKISITYNTLFSWHMNIDQHLPVGVPFESPKENGELTPFSKQNHLAPEMEG